MRSDVRAFLGGAMFAVVGSVWSGVGFVWQGRCLDVVVGGEVVMSGGIVSGNVRC